MFLFFFNVEKNNIEDLGCKIAKSFPNLHKSFNFHHNLITLYDALRFKQYPRIFHASELRNATAPSTQSFPELIALFQRKLLSRLDVIVSSSTTNLPSL